MLTDVNYLPIMKNYSIGIICQNEKLWSLYAWNRALEKLCSNNYYTVQGFWTCEEKFANIKPEKVSKWYYDTYGAWNFIKLGVFFVLFKTRNLFRSILGNYSDSFSKLCKKNKVNYYSTTSPNSIEFVKWVKDEQIDIVIIMVGHILKKEIITAAKMGIINKHAGLLPSNKGIFPYFWAKIKMRSKEFRFILLTKKLTMVDYFFKRKYQITILLAP